MTRLIRTVHKWVGLIAGLQMCLWLVSGLVMSLLNHHVVSGASTAQEAQSEPILPTGGTIIDPQALLQRHGPKTVRTIELRSQADTWLWRLETVNGVLLHDAATGAPVTIDAARARAIAADARADDLAPASARLLTEPTMEARGHDGPLWRVDFNDAQQARYYIAADDGRIVERRTGDWRIFDFFWMLHTMDYRGRDDFNNPLVVTFAFLSVWLALSGVLLLFRSFEGAFRSATKNAGST